jgi:hypothetical protein
MLFFSLDFPVAYSELLRIPPAGRSSYAVNSSKMQQINKSAASSLPTAKLQQFSKTATHVGRWGGGTYT